MRYFTKHIWDFSPRGRVCRKEFWLFYLFFTIYLFAVLYGVMFLLSCVNEIIEINTIVMSLILIFVLFVIGWPSLSMQVKRLHDSGLSAIWVLLHCIPSIGSIILIILLCRKTQLHANEYGPIPEEIARNHNLYTYEETPVTKGNSTLEKSSNPNETNEEFAEEKDSQQQPEESNAAPAISLLDVPLVRLRESVPDEQSSRNQPLKIRAAIDIPRQIKYCRKCGFELIQGSSFCSRCGVKVIGNWE